MSNVYFISDTHFGSEKLIKIENRPFSSVDEMNYAIINNWNQTVGKDDTVIHLGDVAYEDIDYFKLSHIINQLNGHKILIMGNHDKYTTKKYWESVFHEVYDYPIIYNHWYMLSHEPLYMNAHMPYVNIFGHVHSNPTYKDYSCSGFCACVERIGYKPINFTYIQYLIKISKDSCNIPPIERAKEIFKKADKKNGFRLDEDLNMTVLDQYDIEKLMSVIDPTIKINEETYDIDEED